MAVERMNNCHCQEWCGWYLECGVRITAWFTMVGGSLPLSEVCALQSCLLVVKVLLWLICFAVVVGVDADDICELHGPVYDEAVPRASWQACQATSGWRQGSVSGIHAG